MKKFITLLLAAGAFTTSFAQKPSDVILGKKTDKTETQKKKPSDIIFGKKGGSTTDPSGTNIPYPTGSGNEASVDQINREYDAKIASIRNNPTLSAEEKDRMIRDLNRERARKIREVTGQTGDHKNKGKHHDDDDDDNEVRSNKGNNGNHYGWEKGKGNPHRNGGTPGKGNKGKKG